MNDALIAMGANPHLLNTIAQRYAFFGGPPLTRGEVAQSNSSIVVDPTTSPPAHQTGTLSGHARMRPDGFFAPASGATLAGSTDALYDIIFSPSQPWPYTAEAGDPDAPAYAAAMKYITSNLGQDFDQWVPDVRQAYLGAPNYPSWGTAQSTLANVQYPGDTTASCVKDQPVAPTTDQEEASGEAYTRLQFCRLKAELSSEFGWLVDTKSFIDLIDAAFTRAAGTEAGELHALGDSIKAAVDPPNTDIVSPVLFMLESIGELADVLEVVDPAVGVFAGFAADSYDLGSGIASNEGVPVDQQISAKVDDLAAEVATNVSDAANSLDSVRAVAISDYGRLQALAKVYRESENLTVEKHRRPARERGGWLLLLRADGRADRAGRGLRGVPHVHRRRRAAQPRRLPLCLQRRAGRCMGAVRNGLGLLVVAGHHQRRSLLVQFPAGRRARQDVQGPQPVGLRHREDDVVVGARGS